MIDKTFQLCCSFPGVSCYSLHPGVVATEFFAKDAKAFGKASDVVAKFTGKVINLIVLAIYQTSAARNIH